MSDWKFSVEFEGKERELNKELSIDLDDLVMELARQPAEYSYWLAMRANAHNLYEEKKSAHSFLEEEVAARFREQAVYQGIKRTVKEVDQLVAVDGSVKSSSKELLELSRAKTYLDVAVKSFEQRMQALVSISKMEMYQMEFGFKTPRSLREDKKDRRRNVANEERSKAEIPSTASLGKKTSPPSTMLRRPRSSPAAFEMPTMDDFMKELEEK